MDIRYGKGAGKGGRGWGMLLAGLLLTARVAAAPADSLRAVLRQSGLADTTRINLTTRLVRALDEAGGPVTERRQLLLAGLGLARRIKWVPGELEMLNELGGLAAQNSDDNTAQPYYTAAVQRARQTGERRFLAESLQSLAGMAFNRQDAALATRLYRQAIREAEGLPPYYQGRTLLIALGGLSAAYLELQELDSARGPYRRLLELSRQRRDRLTEFVAQARWGSGLQHYPAKLDSAALVLTQAVRLADGLGAYYQAFATMGLMEVREQQGRWPEVQRVATEALRYARQSHTPDYEADALRGLARALHAQGRSAAAFDTLRRAHALLDTLWSHQKRAELLEQQVKFDVGEKEFHIRTLEQQRRVAELRAQQQRLRLWGLGGGLLLVGGLAGLLWQQRRRLQASERQLTQANRTKDQLIRIIGHDLRSPMASLQQLTPLLHEVIEQPERSTAHSLIRTLDAGAQHLGNMVDNLFQWARAQGGQLINNPERLRVGFVLQSMAALYAPTAQLKHIAFSTSAPPELLVWADLGLLTTVLRNLTGNALKFSPKGGAVQLTATARADGAVEFAVVDAGPGIDPAQLAELLTADRLPSTAGTNGEPGTGLGLPLSAKFVGMMGGELHVEAGEGGGTRAWFRLPGKE
ncbi:tetratricopeptide repeat-containing sensor histidine kinase [Hymenobacter sp. ASUV-10]|uniref:histidine kinase n=1 Tax=Hymenobacter aranciens TaxID=3063996 RepID=A0ABT9BDA8_9BACT|nr:tetratricopeptide repeat-containing sensor histidine kinase [Hymenobacter sp. ASUV-10]MDO7875022.1 tetratricopeptide repeat-containing sensor histidine kinase [Hymenobacter sp. ASUV-10]